MFRAMNTYTPPRPPGTYRATFSLPADLAVSINRVAGKLGISQSALLTELLNAPVTTLDQFLLSDPPPSRDTALRFTAGSRDEIRHRILAALRGGLDSTL